MIQENTLYNPYPIPRTHMQNQYIGIFAATARSTLKSHTTRNHTHHHQLPLKNPMIQLDPKILSHTLHLLLNIILHPLAHTHNLLNPTPQKHKITNRKHNPESQMLDPIPETLRDIEIGIFCQSSRSPKTGDLDPIHRRTEELVIALDNAQVAADEDEFLGPFGFVAEHGADGVAGFDLHFERVFLDGFAFSAELAQFTDGSVVAAFVGTHEGCGGEDIWVVDAPAAYYVGDGVVVEGEEGFPEECVLVAELGAHVDVEAVVNENEFRFTGG